MSDYDYVALGSLKLKKDGLSASKKRKKRKKEKRELEKRQLELVEQTLLDNSTATEASTSQTQTVKSKAPDSTSWMTEAQKKFLAQQEKRQLARVMDKATKSHKQRVEEFNTHLEVCFSLSTALIKCYNSIILHFSRIYRNITTYLR